MNHACRSELCCLYAYLHLSFESTIYTFVSSEYGEMLHILSAFYMNILSDMYLTYVVEICQRYIVFI